MIISRQIKNCKEWAEITEEEFLKETEENGYWKPGTAIETLKEFGLIQTPFAIFTDNVRAYEEIHNRNLQEEII